METRTNVQFRQATKDICVDECGAQCCKAPGSFSLRDDEVIRLNRLAKMHRIVFPIFADPYRAGMFMHDFELNDNKHCPFLKDDNTCRIYFERPDACRQYPTKYEASCVLWREG